MTRNISRRSMIGESSCALLGSTSVLSSILNLKLMNQAAAQSGGTITDTKTIVNINLNGGMDSWNLLVPWDTARYNLHQAARGSGGNDLTIPKSELTRIYQASGGDGQDYGIYNELTGIVNLFNGTGFSGRRLSFLTNIGTLVEPTTMAQYQAGSVTLPKALFSHIDQVTQWQTCVPQGMAELSGYAGRMADVLHSTANTQATAMSISLAGNNIAQVGNNTSQFSITGDGALTLNSTSAGSWNLRNAKNAAVNSMVDQTYRNLMRDSFSSYTRGAIDAQMAFKSIYDAHNPNYSVAFPSYGRFGSELQAAARTIAVRNQLGLKRSTIFIELGGWDDHNQNRTVTLDRLKQVSQGLYAFQKALQQEGLEDEVVTFVSSDFGRKLPGNGRGSDHAWGGNTMVMGEPVDGGKVYGTFPDLTLGGDDDVDTDGRFLPSMPVDHLIAELARWFGVSAGDLPYVLPNIGNFIIPSQTPQPIGFIKPGRIT